MNWQISRLLPCGAILLLASVFTSTSHAQNAGVIVDAEGVLRTQIVQDPGGRLHKLRADQARQALDADLARPSHMRLISLNRLETAAKTGLTDDMKYLAGLTRIEYVFFYPESGDIVIAGPAEGYMFDVTGRSVGLTTGKSVLELQDLVVALRAFGPDGASVHQVGCSIDPSEAGLKKMQDFLVSIAGRVGPGDANKIAAGLKESLGKHSVRVDGISPKTHMAQVMVEADYRMKLIGIGLEKPNVKIKSYVDRANSRQISANALQRWYFTPNYECVRVSEDKMAMQLEGDGVKLIGENELVGAGGQRVITRSENPASDAFCANFTTMYPRLADESPVYAQMRNSIDMLIAAAFIQDQDYFGQAGWKMEYFGNEKEYPVETYEAPTHVESAVNVVWKGRSLVTPIGGGVVVKPTDALSPGNILEDEGGAVAKQHEALTLDHLKEGQWWWDAR
jgi:hypothetical protein